MLLKRWTLVAIGGLVAAVALVLVLPSRSNLPEFCANQRALTSLLEAGVDGHSRGVVGMAEDLGNVYARLRDTSPAEIRDQTAITAEHNIALAEEVIATRGHMFQVLVRLPPGTLRGQELRAAEEEIRMFVDAECHR